MKIRGNSRLSPEFALLGYLYLSPGYGYELHQRLVQQFGSIWRTSQSQTYNILKRLELQGYLKSTTIEQEKLPSRQLLHITSTGKERFEAWLQRPTNPSVHAIRVEFITRLHFIRLIHPEQVVEIIMGQRETIQTRIEMLRRDLEGTASHDVNNRFAVELRIKLLTSVLEWLEDCFSSS